MDPDDDDPWRNACPVDLLDIVCTIEISIQAHILVMFVLSVISDNQVEIILKHDSGKVESDECDFQRRLVMGMAPGVDILVRSVGDLDVERECRTLCEG